MVPAGARGGHGGGPPGSALRRPACADVVAGLFRGGRRCRRGRDRGLLIPPDRRGARRQRAEHGPPRVPAYAAGHRADHRVLPGVLERDRRPSVLAPGRARLGRPGDRRQDRPARVRVGQPRPRSIDRHVRVGRQVGGHAVRLLPHQLGPAAAGRQPADLGAQHVGRVRGRPRDRRDHVDARRQELELQARVRSPVRVPARRASPHRHRPDRDVVRRRRGPAQDPPAVARDDGPPERRDQDRDAREPGRPRAGAGGELRGERPGAAGRRRLRRLGTAAVLQRVQLTGPDRLRRPVRGQQLELSRVPLPVDRDAEHVAGGERIDERRAARTCT